MGAHDEYFAQVVRERRKQRGLTMPEVRDLGGPAVQAQGYAERGELPENVRPSTFRKFDTGLGWVPGSARAAYYEGREPRPIDSDGRQPFELGATSTSLDLEQLLPLLEAQRMLHTAAVAELPDAIARLDEAVSGIIGPFVTDILERNRGTQVHPLVEIAFGEALAVPVSPDDPQAAERLYRRWLIGRADDLDDTLRQEFEQRYQSRASR
ncbi:hypothetical protein [Nocardia wallacei]|uniref:hypothetical protein n=1 Tax=Nocardia wallacei TaxID=480035 RepID=UPI002457FEEC|nr:hypothetical protein [Nocardia wallacei]